MITSISNRDYSLEYDTDGKEIFLFVDGNQDNDIQILSDAKTYLDIFFQHSNHSLYLANKGDESRRFIVNVNS